jgi:hypothetical protein
MINRLRILVAMAALSSCAAAIEQRPRFQTVTIARSRATDGGYSGRVHGEPGQPVTLMLQNVSLKFCIQQDRDGSGMRDSILPLRSLPALR